MIKYLKVLVHIGEERPIGFEFVVKEIEHWSNNPLKSEKAYIVCDTINFTAFDNDTRVVVTATVGATEREFVFPKVLYYQFESDIGNKVKEKENV